METMLLQKGIKLIDSSSFKLSDIKPSDYVEQNRVMTSDVSAWEGKFRYDKNPYLKEIINRLSPDDPARIVAVMKGAQIGFTAGVVEGGIVWIISENPGPILFTCGDKELTKEVVEKRLDPAIDSCGLRHLIRPSVVRKKNQRTGDTSTSKEFAGGFLLVDGTNNVNKLRNRSIMYGFIDDFDAAKIEDSKEGTTRSLIEMRFASYAFKMKLFYISTPTVKGRSNIENVFKLGDQRYFNVPCPKCGTYIPLHWRVKMINEENEYGGIHFELDEHGKLLPKSVGYICQHCGEFFTDRYKYDMLQHGKWVPTTEPSEPGYLSYNISSLYSPPGMYNWEHYVRKWLECYPNGLFQKPILGNLKSFLNLCLAQTFEERGKSPRIMNIMQNTRDYSIGTIPIELSQKDGNGMIVMITCSCDLNGFVDDGRLDYEVVAHSETGATYSIDAGSIGTFQRMTSQEERQMYTYRNNELLNVWDIFIRDVLQKQYKTDKGGYMFIHAACVDTGSFTHYANTFVDQCQSLVNPVLTVGIKGDVEKVQKLNVDKHNFKKSQERPNLYILEVNQLKDQLAEKMDLKWNSASGLPQPAGFMNYPEPGEGKYLLNSYFSHFESEHKVQQLNADGSEVGHKWQKKNSMVANHFWDCRIYNMALRDIFADLLCKEAGIKYPSWGDYCAMIVGKK